MNADYLDVLDQKMLVGKITISVQERPLKEQIGLETTQITTKLMSDLADDLNVIRVYIYV